MLSIQDIDNFLEQRNYDLRVSGNGRWIDQKCTPDVLWSIADFILNYVDNISSQFTVANIWESEYAKMTISETYSKPGTDEETAKNEYDKVFSQPMNLLCYAGIITDISPTRGHLYIIENREVLEYIARNDVFSLRFLHCYIEKVLQDIDLLPIFQNFFDAQNKQSFNLMKTTFIDFYHDYTPIKKDFEPKRIFTKVINPLAYKYSKKGTYKGRMSPNIIRRCDLMYNQDNFRDVYQGKPREMTRQEWLSRNPNIDVRNGYFEQMLSNSKRLLRASINEFRANISELTQYIEEHNDITSPTQIHHIFPKNEFPEIMHYLENLIALTPNQHYNFAHPNNNTSLVDLAAQKVLLIAKTHSIEENLNSEIEEPIYEFSNLLTVLSVGWGNDEVLDIPENDYHGVIHTITYHYDAI